MGKKEFKNHYPEPYNVGPVIWMELGPCLSLLSVPQRMVNSRCLLQLLYAAYLKFTLKQCQQFLLLQLWKTKHKHEKNFRQEQMVKWTKQGKPRDH